MNSGSMFYDAGPLEQIAINLFHGWGYNFYRLENMMRSDDLVVRSKVGWLLGRARDSVETAESAYRRTFLPPPSRAKPFPDPDAVAGAQTLERLSRDIGALEGQIRAQPVPENDRMTQVYRQEAETLSRLGECDRRLAGQAELLRQTLEGRDGEWMIANKVTIAEGLTAIGATLRDRQAVLLAG
jgi:hypothetical protein